MSLLDSLTLTGKNLNKRLASFFLNSPTPFDKGGRPDGSPGGHALENYLFFLFQDMNGRKQSWPNIEDSKAS